MDFTALAAVETVAIVTAESPYPEIIAFRVV
jgi:hypothetical protein